MYPAVVADRDDERAITVGMLISQLKAFSPDDRLSFSSLQFLRLKSRGPSLVQVEFNEVVFRDDQGKLIAHDV
jgi:hypothetical protein